MKKILLVLVTLFAIGMTASAQEYRYDQGRKKFVKKTLSYGEVQSSSSLKLSNAATTVWVDGPISKKSGMTTKKLEWYVKVLTNMVIYG